jgi:TrmH family RNA methyltransferase
MLSKNNVSEISALHQKKYRQSTGLFIAEGEKIVDELLDSSWEIEDLITTAALYDQYRLRYEKLQLAETHLFSKISSLKTPAGVLAVVKQKHPSIQHVIIKDRFTLCLDGIRDPGNLGTIIRIADWFGIENIICSEDTVDMYNAKTIQSTMGSFLRVNVIYTSLFPFINEAKAQQVPLFGAVLNGENIYHKKDVKQGIILMGSESHGLSTQVINYIDEPITIPSKLLSNIKFTNQIDSLNVAIATSIICGVFAGHKLNQP